jgi:hypothetical protein
MPGGAGLKADARHDTDTKFDIVRRVRVEVNEIAFVEIAAPGRSLQPQCRVQLSLILGEEFFQRLFGLVLLRQDTFGGHFPDVGWREVNTIAEAIL